MTTPRPMIELRSLLLALLLFPLATLLHAEADFEISEEVDFEVDEDGDGWELKSEHKEYYRFLTERSTRSTHFPVYEPFYAEVDDFYGRYEGGRLDDDWVSYELAESADIFIQDAKIWWIEFPTPKVGDEVMYGYDVEYDRAEWFPVQYISNMGNLRKYRLRIEHPDDVEVSFDFFFPRDEIPYRVERPKESVTMLIIENIEEAETLPFFPFNGLNAVVQVRLEKNGVAITPTKPEEFTRFYQSLFDQAPPIDRKHVDAVGEAIADVATQREKVAAIHDYVRANIRYIAEEDDYGAIIPRAPNLVMSRGYGDCKDRAYLVSTLARQHGIDVHMTLVSTSPTPTFANGTFVNQFNHAICSWNDGEQTWFFDPTSMHTEFGNLPDGDIEGVALVLDPDNPQMVRIPAPDRAPGIEMDVRADITEPKRGEVTITLRNDYASAARFAIKELRGVDRENFLSNMITSHFYKMSIDYFEEDTVGYDFVRFRAVADLSTFLIASRTKQYVPAVPFSLYDAGVLKRESDPWPVIAGIQDPILVRLHLETGEYRPEARELSIGQAQTAAITSSIAASDDGTAVVSYLLDQKRSEYAGEEKKSFLEFCRDFLKGRKEMFVLRGPEEAAP